MPLFDIKHLPYILASKSDLRKSQQDLLNVINLEVLRSVN